MNKKLRQGVVALAIVLACVAGLVSPASAVTLNGTATAGTATLINSTGTVTDTFPLSATGSTGTGCSSTIAFHIFTPTWAISSNTIIHRFYFASVWFIVVSTKTTSTTLNYSGTITGATTTSASLNTSGLNLRFEIYTATNQSTTDTDCLHGTTRKCMFSSVALSVQGTYNGDITNPAASDTATLSSTGTLGATSPPCTAPFTSYNGGTVTASGLAGHVDSVT